MYYMYVNRDTYGVGICRYVRMYICASYIHVVRFWKVDVGYKLR